MSFKDSMGKLLGRFTRHGAQVATSSTSNDEATLFLDALMTEIDATKEHAWSAVLWSKIPLYKELKSHPQVFQKAVLYAAIERKTKYGRSRQSEIPD